MASTQTVPTIQQQVADPEETTMAPEQKTPMDGNGTLSQRQFAVDFQQDENYLDTLVTSCNQLTVLQTGAVKSSPIWGTVILNDPHEVRPCWGKPTNPRPSDPYPREEPRDFADNDAMIATSISNGNKRILK